LFSRVGEDRPITAHYFCIVTLSFQAASVDFPLSSLVSTPVSRILPVLSWHITHVILEIMYVI